METGFRPEELEVQAGNTDIQAGNTGFRPEELDQQKRAELVLDMMHRVMVHYTLWFREIEHQMGFEKAMKAMDYTWKKVRKNAVVRLSKELGQEASAEGIPQAFLDMPAEKQLSLMDSIAKVWLAQDGIWFQAVEFSDGMNDAKRCNDSAWGRFSPFEAHSIKEFLQLPEFPGLAGLEQALNFRMYGRLNVQSSHYDEDGALIFEMNECRVQSARARKGLDDYPCKSAGLVEYSRFAAGIDSRIKTECIGCPPDAHPAEWHCAWKFYIPEA